MAENKAVKAGSLSEAKPAFVLIGRFQRVHGVKGEITLRLLDSVYLRLRPGRKLYLGEERKPVVVSGVRPKNELLLIRLQGINAREDAAELTNLDVYSKTAELPKLSPDEFYPHELIGLQVWDETKLLGVLEEVLKTGANDVYLVRKTDGRELLLPAIPDVILEVDLDQARMYVHLLEGLDE